MTPYFKEESSMVFYTVTTLEKGEIGKVSKRTPGIFTELALAQTAVQQNWGDIFEFYYGYVVIEAMQADVMYPPICPEYDQWWYEWVGDGEAGGYAPCQRPKEYEKVIGFGIG